MTAAVDTALPHWRARLIRLVPGLAISALFIVALFSQAPIARVGEALSRVRPGFVLAALLALAVGYALRCQRWAMMLRSLGAQIRFVDAAVPLMGSVAINNVLPLRAGDVVRIVAFRRLTKVGPAMQLGSLVLERLLDVATLIAILAATLALARVSTLQPAVRGGLDLLACALVAAAVVFVAAPRPIRLLVRAAEGRLPHLKPMGESLLQLSEAITALSHPGQLLRLAVVSLAAWLSEGAAYIAIARALGVDHSLPAGLAALGLGTLATSIPSSPGYVGTFHYFAALALRQFGADPALAAAYAILVHALLWLPTTITGFALMAAMGVRSASGRTNQAAPASVPDRPAPTSAPRPESCDPVVIVGAGFTGLSAAYELARRGVPTIVLEQEASVGGLASGFQVGDATLEKFYHHWFTNDVHIQALVREIGEEHNVVYRPTRTGMYFANTIFRMSTPVDLLKFRALSFPGRLRLGLLALKARTLNDWASIEHMTAREWLIRLAGKEVFAKVWEPLLVGKFGPYADRVGAVWFWKKLALRGGSRAKDGREVLAYYRGGFCRLAETLKAKLEAMGVEIRLNTRAIAVQAQEGRASGVRTDQGVVSASAVLLTQPLPLAADLLEGVAPATYLAGLRRIQYLANVCMVLELDRSLSDTYWLNVNDPSFPFVGVIEHTNFEPPASYDGRRIVYLSKYLPENDPLFAMSEDEAFAYATPHIQRMFPDFSVDWVRRRHVWKARFSQPVAEPNYSRLIPEEQTPLGNVLISTMAQIYPEDRGTNYAVREGRRAGGRLAEAFADVRP
jgi:protoporphyrinogen oxidase/uncharacterized membrane protein YbhN (UPF0104 family)